MEARSNPSWPLKSSATVACNHRWHSISPWHRAKHFRPINSILGNRKQNTFSLWVRKWVKMEGLQHQFLQGLSIAAGTDTKLKPLSLLTPFTQIIKSWMSSLPLIPLRCPYVIADNGEDRKGNGNCPMSHNHWTAISAYHADLTVSSPHGPTDRGTEHYCYSSQIILLCGWQLCLITFSGACTLW